MLRRRTWARISFLLTVVVTIQCIEGQPANAQTPNTDDKTWESQIRSGAASFVDSFNRRDAAAIASHWTEDGVYVSDQGARYEGRAAIQKEYATLFADAPNELHMQLEIDSLRLVAPDTAIEEGRVALVSQPAGAVRVMSQYTAVHVKHNNQWLMANVRDTAVELPRDAGSLEDLDWLVGKWSAGEKTQLVETTCRWIEDRRFLARTHQVTESGKVTSTGIQIIGHDPTTGWITSWSFSNDGGHAVGLWAPTENGWIVDSNGAMSDGTLTHSTDTLLRKDSDTLLWKSEDRMLGDEPLPDVEEVVLKRG